MYKIICFKPGIYVYLVNLSKYYISDQKYELNYHTNNQLILSFASRKSIGSSCEYLYTGNVCTDGYKNRSFLRRLLREKSCQIAALGSRYVPICARIAYRFHLCIARRSNAPLSHLSPHRGKRVRATGITCECRGFPRTVSISQTNRGATCAASLTR